MSGPRPARLLSGLLLACACRAGPIDPEGLRVKFHVTSQEDRPLRYAIVWLQANPSRVVVGQEGKVGRDGNFEVKLSRPPLDTSRLTPKEQLF